MKNIKDAIKKIIQLTGYNLSRFKTTVSPLVYFEIDILLDVGANTGIYAMEVRKNGFKKKIVSFEPLSESYKILKENSKNDKNWKVHDRCAIGSKADQIEMNVSKNSVSSSLLPMHTLHSDVSPNSIYIAKDTAKMITLDSIFNEYITDNDKVFLKVDTQGYEKEVLDGVKNSIKYIKIIELEMSTVPLYESQELYQYFFKFLNDNGFNLWSIKPEFIDPKNSQTLQFNATFVKPTKFKIN
jgi:FkbM family methyltransferase